MDIFSNQDFQSLSDIVSGSTGLDISFINNDRSSSFSSTPSRDSRSDGGTHEDSAWGINSDDKKDSDRKSDNKNKDFDAISVNETTNNLNDDFILNLTSPTSTFFSSVPIFSPNSTHQNPNLSNFEKTHDPLTGEPINSSVNPNHNHDIWNQTFSHSNFNTNPNSTVYNNFTNPGNQNDILSQNMYQNGLHFSITINYSPSSPFEMPDPTAIPPSSDSSTVVEDLISSEDENSSQSLTPSEDSTENIADNENSNLSPLSPNDLKKEMSKRIGQIINQLEESAQFRQPVVDTTNDVSNFNQGHRAIDNLSGIKELGSINC